MPDVAQPVNTGGFFGGIGNILVGLASGYGQGLATRGTSSGRTPGAEQYLDPTKLPAGSAGQQNTTPTGVSALTAGQWIQGVSNKTVVIGAVAVVGIGLIAVFALRR